MQQEGIKIRQNESAWEACKLLILLLNALKAKEQNKKLIKKEIKEYLQFVRANGKKKKLIKDKQPTKRKMSIPNF